MPKITNKQLYKVLYDKSTATTAYVGRASAGSSEASPVWQIFRITKISGLLDKQYADGNVNFDNVWDNRETLSYG